jgi:hypothetical protein
VGAEPHIIPRSRRWRTVVSFVIVALIGGTMGALNAPLWTSFLVLPIICFTLLPWAMFGEIK